MSVLNVMPVMETDPIIYKFIIAGFLFIAAFLICAKSGLHVVPTAIIGAIAILFVFAGIIGSYCYDKIDTGRKRIEVVFNEDVSFEDVYSKYRIIEKRGTIYVLEEKEID